MTSSVHLHSRLGPGCDSELIHTPPSHGSCTTSHGDVWEIGCDDRLCMFSALALGFSRPGLSFGTSSSSSTSGGRKESQRGAMHDNGMLRGTLSVLSSCTASSLAPLLSLAIPLLCVADPNVMFIRSKHAVTHAVMVCTSCCDSCGDGVCFVPFIAAVGADFCHALDFCVLCSH